MNENFDESCAKWYRSRSGQQRYAFWNPDGAIYKKDTHWGPGHEQTMAGGHYIVVLADAKRSGVFDVYGIEKLRFESEHVPIAGAPNLYEHHKRVIAYRLDAPTRVRTVVEGRVETDREIPAGHWLVQQPKGEVQGIAPEQFEMIYEQEPT